MLVYTIIPTIFSFYLGAWCDIYGRKFLIKLFLFAEIFSRGNMIVNAYFMDLKKEFLFIGVIPYGIVGNIYLEQFDLALLINQFNKWKLIIARS